MASEQMMHKELMQDGWNEDKKYMTTAGEATHS
jgi:hypothetical protein